MPDSWDQTAQICWVMARLWSEGKHKHEDFIPHAEEVVDADEFLESWH